MADVEHGGLGYENGPIRHVGLRGRGAVAVDGLRVVTGEAVSEPVVLGERLHRRARQAILASQDGELVVGAHRGYALCARQPAVRVDLEALVELERVLALREIVLPGSAA